MVLSLLCHHNDSGVRSELRMQTFEISTGSLASLAT